MIFFQRVFLFLSAALLLALYLPQLFWLVVAHRDRAPIPFWSPVDERFLFIRPSAEGSRRTDASGMAISREEFEGKLPLAFQAQLLKEGRMPEVLNGIKLTPAAIREGRLTFKASPRGFDFPSVPLYPLFEAESGRARLALPPDFMRLGRTIEFIDAKTNQVNAEKSKRFRDAFLAEGFKFPVRLVGGNPTTLKPYDEGYYLTDASGFLFHLRMVKDQPRLSRVPDPDGHLNPPGFQPIGIYVQEQESRELRVILIGAQGEVFFVVGESLRITPIPLREYRPHTMTLSIRGDMLSRLFTSTGDGKLEVVATDRALELLAMHEESLPTRDQSTPGRWASAIFPLQWDIESPDSGYLGFHTRWGTATAWIVWLLPPAIGAILLLSKRKTQPLATKHRP
ncbi:MAG: DUF4857 domain-containing protein [Verrucomicrobiia bacterium]